MRELADADRIQSLMRALGREAKAPGHVYFTGGATAVLLGWRKATIDVDIKIVPEQDAVLRAVPALKEQLQVNVELASPDDFIPVREDWEDRSPFIAQEALLGFYHFEPAAQALAKIERGHAQDLEDVRVMLERGLVDREGLRQYFAAIQPQLYRYPAIDRGAFARSVDVALGTPG
jgi:hypothetical protein